MHTDLKTNTKKLSCRNKRRRLQITEAMLISISNPPINKQQEDDGILTPLFHNKFDLNG